MSVDQVLVDNIQQEVSLRLNHEQKKRVNDGLPELSIADERQLIRAQTQKVIEERTEQMAARGVPPLHPSDERELAEKVVARLSTNADPDLARRIHRDVGTRLSKEQTRRRSAGQPELTGPAERMFADKLIADVLSEHADQQLAKGQSPLDPTSEKRLREAVTARLFGAGRLDELLKDESIENIDINGFDRVWVTRAGSTTHELVDPVASSDDELIELIQGLAAYSGLNSRPWDTANPQLDLQLPDGSRLSAVQSVSTRPSISIRRDRLEKVELADLVGNGTVTEDAADLLRALIKGRFNVMVAGATRAGKALALDTPIPTPSGWTTMGELEAGDTVFDDLGKPCKVLIAHEVMNGRECFEVEFNTGDVIVADGDHLWEVSSREDRQRQRRAKQPLAPEEQSLLALEARTQSMPDEQMTVADLVLEVGAHWTNSVARLARNMEPDGYVHKRFKRAGSQGDTHHPVATYSRQALLKELVAWRVAPRAQHQTSQIRTTSELRDTLRHTSGTNNYFRWSVKSARGAQYAQKEQLIDPWVLGIWLGDGSTACGEITTADEWVLEEFIRLDYPSRLRSPNDPYRYKVYGGLHAALRKIGVLGNKHIPDDYLHGDEGQRRALLAGLLDSDGTTASNGCIEFTSTNHTLAEQTRELIASLGYVPHSREKQIVFDGRPMGPCWTISFSTDDEVFRIPRKAETHQSRTRHTETARLRRARRAIVDVRPVKSVPVRCITVDSPTRLYLAGRSYIPTHNTTLLRALAREIGPHERIITIERSLELGLARYEDRHPNCVEFEERLANAEGLGAVSMKELVRRTLRQNPDRAIVGEVLGPEVVDMLNAMSQGNDGSLSTIHARSARQTFERIATYAIQAEERLPHEATYAMIAGALDYVVYISQDIHTGKRRLETILEVNGYDQTVASTEIFKLGPSGDAEWTRTQPARFQELAAAGWRQPEAW